MIDNAVPSEPTTAPAPDRARLERQVWVLGVLAQVGSLICALIGQAWRARQDGAAGLPGLGLLVLLRLDDRARRAVRLAQALRMRLLDRLAGREAVAAAAPAPAQNPAKNGGLNAEGLLGEIDWDRVLAREMASDERELTREMREALDGFGRPEFSKALLERPVDDLIASICRDLGLDPGWLSLAGGEPDAADIEQAVAAAVEALVKRYSPKRPKARPRAAPAVGADAPQPTPSAASP